MSRVIIEVHHYEPQGNQQHEDLLLRFDAESPDAPEVLAAAIREVVEAKFDSVEDIG